MLPSPMQVVVALALVLALGGIWYCRGRNRWREAASERLYLGIPWGTLVLVAINLGFYLVLQGGLWHWSNPSIYPFISWSYFYPLGLVTSAIAHASPAHIVGNVTATLAFGPIAEYAWGHYPGGSRDVEAPGDEPPDDAAGADGGDGETAAGADFDGRGAPHDANADAQDDESWRDDELMPDGYDDDGFLGHPVVRAFLVFPAAVLLVGLLTSGFSIAPSLGFSGAVYGLAGFAVVRYPIPSLVGGIVASGLGVAYEAISQPVAQGAFESGAPGLPSWAGVGFQAHALGFLLGALGAIALLAIRDRRVTAERVFFGVLLWGMVYSLWLVALPQSTDVYTLYRGAGVIALVAVSAIVTVAVAGSDEPLPRPFADASIVPSRRTLAIAWLAIVALVFLFFASGFALLSPPLVLAVALFSLALALPALPVVLPDQLDVSPVGYRQVAIGALLAVAILVAVPGVPLSTMTVDAEAPPEGTAVEIEDYTIYYAENATSERGLAIGETNATEQAANATAYDGVILVSEERHIWNPVVRADSLAYAGNETIVVGGVGWRETVRAERTAWRVAGNDTAYAVDLHHDGETVRSFATEPLAADVRIDGYGVTVVPGDDAFQLEIAQEGSVVDTVAIPEANGSTAAGDVTIRTERHDDVEHVYVETADSRAVVAEAETYD